MLQIDGKWELSTLHRRQIWNVKVAPERVPLLSCTNVRMWCAAATVFCLITTSCSVPEGIHASTIASTRFHELVDAGQFNVIYDGATEAFKKAVPRDKFLAFMKSAQTKMGVCNTAKLTRNYFFASINGGIGNLSYIRRCEKGRLYEDFQWRVVRGKAMLQSYSPKSGL
jgi:hypothetical protein